MTPDLVAGLHETFLAANAGDPGPTMTLPHFTVMVTDGWSSDLTEAWVVTEGGRVVAGYSLTLPQDDNTHRAVLGPLVVRPGYGGRGLGTALLEHATARTRDEGRTLLSAELDERGPGARFAERHGFTRSLAEARRVLDLREADWAGLEAMLAQALPGAAGYVLERWAGPPPEHLLADLATLMGGMNDAPKDDEVVEDVRWDVERVRLMERGTVLSGQSNHIMVARRASDGAPAGLTRIVLNLEGGGGWCLQHDTVVLREHRGHRLGLVLKLGNLLWLRERDPGAERIITWNATSNSHMLAINEAMGFKLLDEWTVWRKKV